MGRTLHEVVDKSSIFSLFWYSAGVFASLSHVAVSVEHNFYRKWREPQRHMFLYLASHSHKTDAIHGWAPRLHTDPANPPCMQPGIKYWGDRERAELCVWLSFGNVYFFFFLNERDLTLFFNEFMADACVHADTEVQQLSCLSLYIHILMHTHTYTHTATYMCAICFRLINTLTSYSDWFPHFQDWGNQENFILLPKIPSKPLR